MIRKLLSFLFPPLPEPTPEAQAFSAKVAAGCLALRQAGAQTAASTEALRACGAQLEKSLARERERRAL